MTITVRRHAQWDLYALELGCRGVHTGITRGLSRVAGGKHLDKLARACVTRRGVGLGEPRRFRRPCLLHVIQCSLRVCSMRFLLADHSLYSDDKLDPDGDRKTEIDIGESPLLVDVTPLACNISEKDRGPGYFRPFFCLMSRVVETPQFQRLWFGPRDTSSFKNLFHADDCFMLLLYIYKAQLVSHQKELLSRF